MRKRKQINLNFLKSLKLLFIFVWIFIVCACFIYRNIFVCVFLGFPLGFSMKFFFVLCGNWKAKVDFIYLCRECASVSKRRSSFLLMFHLTRKGESTDLEIQFLMHLKDNGLGQDIKRTRPHVFHSSNQIQFFQSLYLNNKKKKFVYVYPRCWFHIQNEVDIVWLFGMMMWLINSLPIYSSFVHIYLHLYAHHAIIA